MPKIQTLILSGYDTLSHKYWHHSIVNNIKMCNFTVMTLPPRFFSWRVRGGPISFLKKYPELLNNTFDLIISSSMVDIASLKGIYKNLSSVPVIYYFNENQFVYPASKAKSNLDPKIVSLYGGMASDLLLFNSKYNRDSFTKGVIDLLKNFPDFVDKSIALTLANKSFILPIPLMASSTSKPRNPNNMDWKCPVILWNHRWEYDKAPERFLLFLDKLSTQINSFKLVLLGERFREDSCIYKDLLQKYQSVILWNGFVEEKDEYFELINKSDFVISTAIHEFQGISMLEAISMGLIPLAPNRLVYPEYISSENLYPSYLGNMEKESEEMVNTFLKLYKRKKNYSAQLPIEYSINQFVISLEKTICELLKTI